MSSNNNVLVKMNNAGYRHNDKWLVQGVSLTVEKGKIVTLIGPNGSGKSTTAKIALGILKKIDGHVEKYTNKIGYVPQKISVDWTLPLRVYDFMILTENLDEKTIDEALSLTGVIHLKDKSLGNLSGGERQGVAIARAIYNEAELIVLDEPTNNLSLNETQKVFDFISNVKETGRSVLFIGHNIYHVYDISDRFVILDRGEIIHKLNKQDVASPENLMKIMRDTIKGH